MRFEEINDFEICLLNTNSIYKDKKEFTLAALNVIDEVL